MNYTTLIFYTGRSSRKYEHIVIYITTLAFSLTGLALYTICIRSNLFINFCSQNFVKKIMEYELLSSEEERCIRAWSAGQDDGCWHFQCKRWRGCQVWRRGGRSLPRTGYYIEIKKTLSVKHLSRGYVFIKPARSAGFSRIKKIPYQAPPTQLGPRKCTFQKNAILGPKYQC